MPFASKGKPMWLEKRSSYTFIIATVAIGLLTDLIFYGIQVPILPFLLTDQTHIDPKDVQSWISALLAAYAGASVLFSPIAGVIADRTKSRRAPFLAGLVCLTLATGLLWISSSIALLIIARIFQGVSGALVWTVGLALIIDTVGPSRLGTTMGTIFSAISFGDFVAPVAGGALYKVGGQTAVFGAASALILIDFVMRIFVIEKSRAKDYLSKSKVEDQDAEEADENQPLLDNKETSRYKLPDKLPRLVAHYPILYCFKNPALSASLFLIIIQATLLGAFDATIPKYTQDLFGFTSLKAGAIFLPLQVPNLVFGPVFGWLVDKRGSRFVATLSYLFLAPCLLLLRIPQSGQIVTMCVILAFNGVFLAGIGSPSIVTSSKVVDKFNRANPDRFGPKGPFAQLYGLSSMCFSAGLTLGPIIGGSLKEAIGFGNAFLIWAVVSLLSAILSFYTLAKV